MTAPNRHTDLEAYVDGELDVAARAAVDIHVAGCAACRAELEALQVLQRRLASHPVPDPGERYWASFAARVESRLRSDAEPGRGWERLTGWLFPHGRFAWPRAAGAVAMCTLLVYVGLRGFDPALVRVEPRTTAGTPVPAPAAPAPVPPAPVPVPAPASEPPAPAPRTSAPQASAPSPTLAPTRRPESSPSGPVVATPVPALKPQAGSVAPPPAPEPSSVAMEKDVGTLSAVPRSDATGSTRPASKPDLDQAAGAEREQVSQPRSESATLEARSRAAPAPKEKALAAPLDDAKRDANSSDAVHLPQASGADPVVGFLAAASTGDVIAARAAAAATGIDAETQQTMQRWLQMATVPSAAAPKANGFAPAPPAKLSKLSEDGRSQGGSGVESLLLLDALATPRRADPAVRTSVVRITTGLLPHANDPRVVPRVRASLEWLAATSESEPERQHWRTELDRWPTH